MFGRSTFDPVPPTVGAYYLGHKTLSPRLHRGNMYTSVKQLGDVACQVLNCTGSPAYDKALELSGCGGLPAPMGATGNYARL